MKKGLQKPEPVSKKDIPPFIPDIEMKSNDDDDFIRLPSPPVTKYEIDTKRPITKLVDKEHNLIKVIPKIDTAHSSPVCTIHSPVLGEVFNDKNVSSGIQKAFPNVRQKITSLSELKVLQDNPDALIAEDKELEIILEKILNEGSDEHESLKFFFGGDNKTFNNKLIELQLDKGNEGFIEFLVSEFCSRIMKEEKLKIHIESGDIYFDKFNTRETIYDFFKMQQNNEKIFIDHDFYYNKSYQEHFKEYLKNINGEVNARYDYFTNRNSKYLFYCFNDILLNSGGELLKIRHSEKIKDELAIAEIEKTDWQYFITKLIEIVNSIEIGDDEFDNEQVKATKDYQKNLLLLSKLYNKFYTNTASVFGPMIKNLPTEERNEIQNELVNNGIERIDFNTNLGSSDFLDKYIQFYFDNGRFPGNTRMIILPKPTLPNEIENTNPI